MGKIPEWMLEHLTKCVKAFGIRDTTVISIRRKRRVAGDRHVAGETRLSPRYLEAVVTLRKDLKDNAASREDITHELLHVALIRHRQAVERIIGLVPESLRTHAWDLYNDGNEAAVTQLARGLTPLLMAMDLQKNEEPANRG